MIFSFQGKKNIDFRRAGELLYALDAFGQYSDKKVGKIAMQKVVYLAEVLSPIKKILLDFSKGFITHFRGPYNYDIQNILDHLVVAAYVDITDYEQVGRGEQANYIITERGRNVIKRLTLMPNEEEKHWWYTSIVRLILVSIEGDFKTHWYGLNKVIDLTYTDETFLNFKEKGQRQSINFRSEEDETKQLISELKNYLNFRQKYVEVPRRGMNRNDSREYAQLLLISFFEYMLYKKTKEVYE